MKTYSAKPTDVQRRWYVIDASELTLGRISTKAASLLIGKEKPSFTKHIDCGDFVIVINSDKLRVTGNKLTQKTYYRHSSYPSGLTATLLKDKLENDSREVIIHSIRGMLPVNKLRDARLARLKVYKGDSHIHEAQKPTLLKLAKESK